MKKTTLFFTVALILMLGTVSATTLFEDNFNDEDYTNNPFWLLGAGTANVSEGQLYFTGAFDTSGRLTTIMDTIVNENNVCDFSFSYSGALLSDDPQAGRTVNLELDTDLSERNYGLRIYNGNGFIDSFPNNHDFITFGFGGDDTRDDRVISSIHAEYNKSYDLEAKRINGLWSFYIDHSLIGTTLDDMQCNNLTHLTFFNVGVGKADNIKIVKLDEGNNVPEFSTLAILFTLAISITFIVLNRN